MAGTSTSLEHRTGYDQVTMYVFSGTGNTLRTACWMAETAEHDGVPTAIHQIPFGCPPARAGGPSHLVGLLTPTHGFTAPWWMIRFALGMPWGRGTHAFVAVTRGGFKIGRVRVPGLEGTAGYLLAILLMLMGYRVRGVLALDMPSNWTSVHLGLPDEAVRALEARAQPLARAYIQRLLTGHTAFGGLLGLAIGLLLLPVSVAYLLYGRFFLAKLFFANNSCNGCGLCAQHCPVGAIRMIGGTHPRPYWTFSCESCMRCMAYCPRKAIEAGHSWGVLLGYLSSIPVGWVGAHLLTSWSPWVRACGTLPVWLVCVAVAYLLFWMLLRIPLVNALFTWTTLTHYFRRYHEPHTRLHHLDCAVPPEPSRPQTPGPFTTQR